MIMVDNAFVGQCFYFCNIRDNLSGHIIHIHVAVPCVVYFCDIKCFCN